jgi:glycosyltransferase involved in cell wall biosynthesis
VTARLSVVVPARDAAHTLASAVGSVLDQEVDVEVIIVDDASSDATAKVAATLAQDRRVRVVHRVANGGPAVARNDGLRRSHGEFVLFLDADDRLTPGALVALSNEFEPDVVAVLGRFDAVDEAGEHLDIGTWAGSQLRPVVRRSGRYVDSPDGFTAEALLTRLVSPPPGGVLVRRASALAVGGYDSSCARSEDLDFLVRLSTRGRIVALERVVLVYTRQQRQRSAAVHRRQLGRQRTMLALVLRAPTRPEARARARGIVAHHLDRASTRWHYGGHGVRDAAAVARSLALAGAFGVLGRLAPRRGP